MNELPRLLGFPVLVTDKCTSPLLQVSTASGTALPSQSSFRQVFAATMNGVSMESSGMRMFRYSGDPSCGEMICIAAGEPFLELKIVQKDYYQDFLRDNEVEGPVWSNGIPVAGYQGDYQGLVWKAFEVIDYVIVPTRICLPKKGVAKAPASSFLRAFGIHLRGNKCGSWTLSRRIVGAAIEIPKANMTIRRPGFWEPLVVPRSRTWENTGELF